MIFFISLNVDAIYCGEVFELSELGQLQLSVSQPCEGSEELSPQLKVLNEVFEEPVSVIHLVLESLGHSI
jgi:hypothetical protein